LTYSHEGKLLMPSEMRTKPRPLPTTDNHATIHVPGTVFKINLRRHNATERGVAVREALQTTLRGFSSGMLSRHGAVLKDALGGRIALAYAETQTMAYSYVVLEGSILRPASRVMARWARRHIRHARMGNFLHTQSAKFFFLPLTILVPTYLCCVFIMPHSIPDDWRVAVVLETTNPFSPFWQLYALVMTSAWWLPSVYHAWLAWRLHRADASRVK
jgi:hypothetical protein